MSVKKLLSVVSAAVLALSLAACGEKEPAPTAVPTATATEKAQTKSLEELTAKKDYITITVDINGEEKTMKGEIYPDLAPETVANFEKLADENFYDGLIFHRVIPEFMIQGGGYDKDMKEKPAATIKANLTRTALKIR